MSQLNSGLPNQPDKTLGTGTPASTTTITTPGAGTFVPKAATKWMKVTLVPAGGGGGAIASGGSGTAGGGQAGAPVVVWVQKTAASYPYNIGAAGAAGNSGSLPFLGGDGGNTTFGGFTAYGGKGGYTNGASSSAFDPRGQSSGWGQGGTGGTAATGFGSGGGGAITVGNGFAGGGGLLYIEEY